MNTDRHSRYLPVFGGSYLEKLLGIQAGSLIGYWPLSEAAGAAAVDDKSAQGNNGTPSNVTFGVAGIGDGLTCGSFNGTSSYIQLYSAGLAADINVVAGTVALWAKVSGAGVWTDGALRACTRFLFNASADYLMIYKATVNNTLSLRIHVPSGDYMESVTYSSTGWFHTAITWDHTANQIKLYLNGAQQGATKAGFDQFVAPLVNNGAVAGAASAAGNFWSGYLAHVGLWTKALSAGEVSQLAKVA